MFGKQGVGFDRQVVDGDMRRLQRQSHLQILLQICCAFIGQCIHQIDVESVKRQRCFLHCRYGLRTVVHPTDGLKMLVVETLHTDLQACNARFFVSVKTVFFKRARVGL